MDIVREIIACVLDTQNLQPFLNANITPGAVRFYDSSGTDSDQTNAYRWIFDYNKRYGRVPSWEIFERNHPKFDLSKTSEYTADELIDEIHREQWRVRYEAIGTEITGVLVKGLETQSTSGLHEIPGMLERLHKLPQKAGLTESDNTPFRLRTLGELANMPDPEPRLEDIIDQGTVTLLSGFSGTGKSFLALDWAAHIAAGEPWLGHEVRQGCVLYVAAEGAWGMKKRVAAWQRKHVRLSDDQFRFIIDPVQLGDDAHVSAIAQIVREHGIEFVVLDTLARCSVGLEENSATDMGRAISNAYKIRDARGEGATDVLIVHHSGYDTKKARGSTALQANVDNAYQLTSEDPHTGFALSTTKRKDGPPHAEISLRLEEFRGSCVVADGPQFETGPSLLSLLKTDIGQTLTELAGQVDASRQAVHKQLKSLEEKGLAEREIRGGRTGDLWYRTASNSELQ